MSVFTDHPWLITLAASELFLVITRSRDITVLIKSPHQRTKSEQQSLERGLVRSFLLEILLFVPVSAALVLMLLPLIRSRFQAWFDSPTTSMAAYALVGLVSYGFPFAAVKQIVIRVALNTLKEFSDLKSYKEGITPAASSAAPEPGEDVH